MLEISGIVLTKNNQQTIGTCLTSLKDIISELIIIDDYSHDDTIAIIKGLWPEAKIFSRHLDRFDRQRNYGLSQAKYDWVLMLDSDEMISEKLEESIKGIVSDTNTQAFWTDRHNRFFEVYLKENYWNRPILFKRSLRFKYPVHEILEVDRQKMKKLPGHIIHENWFGIAANWKKMDRYSSLLAQKWQEQERNYNKFLLFWLGIILPIRYFFICFFKKGFWRAGITKGILYSLLESSWWLAVALKYQELKEDKKI